MDLSKNLTEKQLRGWFADSLKAIQDEIGFKVSSRGWGYIMEQKGLITKDQFDKVAGAINRCRVSGILPVDFVKEEGARMFEEIHEPDESTLPEHVAKWLGYAYNCDNHFEPNWWDGEKYYIQMVVEKIDLVTLFQPICREFHIPIANSKGWSSILQRADYARRFQEAEDKGLQCVLLYCGDHDPDGLRISDTLRKNIEDLKDVEWSDGTMGYDPSELIIDRFGLEYDFIIDNNLTWIDNLITGRGMDLASPKHPNYYLPYLQDYLKKVGARKCEANSVVIVPEMGRQLCIESITKYLGKNARARFREKKAEVREKIDTLLDEVGIRQHIVKAIEDLNNLE
jgi:hypothetical protein